MRYSRGLRLLLPPLIFLMAAAVFSPALRGEFLNWDDSANFVANPHYRGLGWPQIKWMLGATLMGHYIPVTWLSLGMNYAVGGMNPWGYHLGNLLLHAASTTLVYLIARRLLAAAHGGGAQGGHTSGPIVLAGAFAALVWGVHPLRVESVAWITERRDVLCGLFFLLTILAYLKGLERDGRPRPIWQALSLGAFAVALLSKAAAMPCPRFCSCWIAIARRWGTGWKALIVEKVRTRPRHRCCRDAPSPYPVALATSCTIMACPRVGMAYGFVFTRPACQFASPMHGLPTGRARRWPFLPAFWACW
jgi:hypothetical protein